MTLDLQTLQHNAEQFIRDCEPLHYEMGHAQKFIASLCKVYGLDAHFAVQYEHRVRKADLKGINRIDGFFPGLLMIEMKSAGEDLEAAFIQALEYVQLIERIEDKPRHILVSDFKNLHLYELNQGFTGIVLDKTLKIKLTGFRAHVQDFAFIAGYEAAIAERNEALTIAAAAKLAALHQEFHKQGYQGAELQTMLVRILFCLFADDTGLFAQNKAFEQLVEESLADGADLGSRLNALYKWLDTPEDKRRTTPRALLDQYSGFRLKFPYINGKLFSDGIDEFVFNASMRRTLLECCEIDWSLISPDIFGTLFQNIMENADAPGGGKKSAHRRELGAHYTSEKNIKRAIAPLFLDRLKAELEQAAGDPKKLARYITRLQTLQILDPACGCGNFLIVAYREIRLLEMQAIRQLARIPGAQQMQSQCDVHQFHGIEIDPAAVEIATVAMWLTDHQMNRLYQDGYKRIPLAHKADIRCANALQTDWADTISPQNLDYIVGNPPFLGKKEQNAEQKKDMEKVVGHFKGSGILDYVTAWYFKANELMKHNPKIRTAFVSTNSITQGEQVPALWKPLLSDGIRIRFAHRTFKWNNEGKGTAAVHCVIIGFDRDEIQKGERLSLWDYSQDIGGDGKEHQVRKINPYLLEADNILPAKRSRPVSADVPAMNYGNMPIDNGLLILSQEAFQTALNEDPENSKLIRPYMGGSEFLNNEKRYCLWLENVDQERLSQSKFASERVGQVRAYRLSSSRAATVKLAETPHLFGEIRQPDSRYLLLPKVSSENRRFLPIGYIEPETIANGSALIIPNATLYHFGILSSTMHNAFMRTVAGRMKSDYQYSASIVYNNFPFPENPCRAAVETAAQAVLDARAAETERIRRPMPTPATLYNPGTMPSALAAAHNALDDAVDEAYGYTDGNSDSERTAFLFRLYKNAV